MTGLIEDRVKVNLWESYETITRGAYSYSTDRICFPALPHKLHKHIMTGTNESFETLPWLLQTHIHTYPLTFA
jgi:hypothetical protein